VNSELRIVRHEQFAQGGSKNVLKKRSFLLIFAQIARTFVYFVQLLLIFANFCSPTCANGSKTCAFARKFNAFANKPAHLVRKLARLRAASTGFYAKLTLPGLTDCPFTPIPTLSCWATISAAICCCEPKITHRWDSLSP